MEYREDGDEENGVEQARETVRSGRLARHSSKSCAELSRANGNWYGKRKKTYPSINCISALSSSTTLTFKRMTYTA